MAEQYKPKPKKVTKSKPNSVKIEEFHPMAVPGAIPGAVNIIVFGLGNDEKIYQWNGEEQEWTYETTE